MAKKKKTESGIIGLIQTRQSYHNTQSIERWRQAILAFENQTNPSRTTLYDMFEDILLDGQVEATWAKRRDNILNRRLVFKKDGKESEDITRMLNSPDMTGILKDLLDTVLFGYTLLQFNGAWYDSEQEHYRIDYDLIPRKHVHPEPAFECISKEQSDCSRDFLYMNPPLSNYMVWAGNHADKGLLVKVAPYVIYKRGGMGDWAQFSEMFGMPWREAIYNSYDNETRNKINAFFEEWGAGSYLIHQNDIEIKMHDSGASSASVDVYNKFIQTCDASISKIILGNTLTTEQGDKGARSLGEVHENEENDKKGNDDKFILSILNTQFRAVMKRLGIDMSGGEIWFATPEKKWHELKTKWEVIDSIGNKVPVDDDFIYEEFDIPKPENYNEMKAEKTQNKADQPPEPKKEKDDKKQHATAELSFFDRLLSFFALAPAPGAYSGTRLTAANEDAGLIERVWNGDSDYFDADLFQRLSKDLLNAIETGFNNKANLDAGKINIAYDAPDDVFRTAMEQNIFHFSAAKTLAEIQALNQALNESKNFAEFSRKAEKITTTFNKRWQQTEYHTAVNCAEQASTYRRLKSMVDLFPFWEYTTAGDDLVRPEHAELDGVILRQNDPRWDEIYPPNGWNCRCYVVPRMEGEQGNIEEAQEKVDKYKETKDWQMAKAQGWNINRAKEGLVFNANQMYIRKFPDNAASYMDKVKPDRWGLNNSVKKLVAQAAEELKLYTGTADDWWKANATIVDGKELLAVKDYNGRTWYMDKKYFDMHTTDKVKKRAFRTKYLNSISETLKNPDEVWLGRTTEDIANGVQSLNNYTMIKYYKGLAIGVYCKMENGNMFFRTWFPLRDKRVRNGILVRKK